MGGGGREEGAGGGGQEELAGEAGPDNNLCLCIESAILFTLLFPGDRAICTGRRGERNRMTSQMSPSRVTSHDKRGNPASGLVLARRSGQSSADSAGKV